MSVMWPEGQYMLWDGVNWNVLNAPPVDSLISTDPGNVAVLGTDHLVHVPSTAYDSRFLAKSGGTVTGPIVLPTDAAAALEAVPKRQLDSTMSSHTAAADPHPQYLTQAEGDAMYGNQVSNDARYLNTSGDTLTGDLTAQGYVILNQAPVSGLHAANKTYVDTQRDTRVAKAGDTMTGNLILNADPSAALGAATKQYVDNLTSTAIAYGSASSPTAGSKFNIGNNPVYRGNGFSTSSSTVSAQFNGNCHVSGYFAWTMNAGTIYMSVSSWFQVVPGTIFQGQVDFTFGTTQEYKSGIYSSNGGPTLYLAVLRPPASTFTGVTSVTAYLTFQRL